MKIIFKNTNIDIVSVRTTVQSLLDELNLERLSTANPPIDDDGSFDYQLGEVITMSAPHEYEWDTVEYASNYYTTKHIALPSGSLKVHYVGKATGSSGINIYNSSKELIGSVSGIDAHQGGSDYLLDWEVELPANAAYIRCTCAKSIADADGFKLDVTKTV